MNEKQKESEKSFNIPHTGTTGTGHAKWADIYEGAKPEDLPWYSPFPTPTFWMR